MNLIVLSGRLTKDPETKNITTAKGDMKVANFSVAYRQYSKTDETGYMDVSIIGKTAEVVKKYLRKGSSVTVQGELHQRKYTDKNGQARTAIEIKASAVDLPPKSENGGGSSQATDTNGNPSGGNVVDDNDIPF